MMGVVLLAGQMSEQEVFWQSADATGGGSVDGKDEGTGGGLVDGIDEGIPVARELCIIMNNGMNAITR